MRFALLILLAPLLLLPSGLQAGGEAEQDVGTHVHLSGSHRRLG